MTIIQTVIPVILPNVNELISITSYDLLRSPIYF
jgi:hypothetical protein